MCERFHRSLEATLQASFNRWQLGWLSSVGLCSAVKEDLRVFPAELVLQEFLPESPPCVLIPLCCLSIPQETHFLFLARSTIACSTLLFQGRWTLLRPQPIDLHCIHCMKARSGLFNRAKSISFWTLAIGRRLSLLIDLSLHMFCKMIRWCRRTTQFTKQSHFPGHAEVRTNK